ncbi:MAG: nodulation protein NfeD [marine benthic group bacterium]|nr:nodulation protein NfeD [Gemmatimonadota bacterium]MCL7962653.1 nodulation protein NfeD [Candidatus Carthagonibacter metallireducens]MCL7985145.1 nodulation protein NfeD [Gemmatimonadota bacterium]
MTRASKAAAVLFLSAGIASSAIAALAGILSGATQTGPVIYRIPVHGAVELGLAPFIERALDEAEETGAELAVLDIDTPGGRVDAAWQIVDAVRESGIPTAAYVNRRALSAGAMIALATDRLYMRPGSSIGAATPVDSKGNRASEKMVSAMRAEFRSLAEDRQLDPRIGEAMVDESIVIDGLVGEGKLLTLTTEEAVRVGVANGTVESWDELVAIAGAPSALTVVASPNWAENLVRLLTHPALAPMLLSLGFLGLLVEIKTPTFGLAGGVGLLCLAAFFGARWLVNLAGMEEVLLLGAGVVLVALEILVVPGIGVAGVLGSLAILASVTLSMVGSYPTMSEVIGALGIVAISILALGLLAFGVLRHIPHSRGMSGIFLKRSTSRETGYLSAPDMSGMVGASGMALTDLRPSGTARFGDDRLDVVTEGPWIEEGTKVKVVRAGVSGLVVREISDEAEA